MKKFSKQVQVVIDILQNEVDGDVRSALQKMTKDYSMTWVYFDNRGKSLFPSTGNNLMGEMEDVYPIKGRQYDIKNIAEGEDVVMVELVESYPDPKTKEVYRTPLVLVLEMKQGKIRTGRHYLDPQISRKCLSKKQVGTAYKKAKKSLMVIS